MGSLEDFEKKIRGSKLDGHVATTSQSPTRIYTDVATSPDHTMNADQFNSTIGYFTTNKPRVINFSKYYTLPSYQNQFRPEAKDLHTPKGLDIYSLQRHKIRNHHAKDYNDSLEKRIIFHSQHTTIQLNLNY